MSAESLLAVSAQSLSVIEFLSAASAGAASAGGYSSVHGQYQEQENRTKAEADGHAADP